MSDSRYGSDELIELQQRGLELAMQEAKDRGAEIDAILFSRRVLQTAREDPSIRETRLAILEELTHASYPSATVLAATRHLASEAARRHFPRSRRTAPIGRNPVPWHFLVGAAWVAALALLITGSGESALGAHFTSGVLLVWAVFVLMSGLIIATWAKRWWRARSRSTSGGPRRPVTA